SSRTAPTTPRSSRPSATADWRRVSRSIPWSRAVGEGTLALKGPTKPYELRGKGQPVPVDSNIVVSLVVVADRALFHPEAEVKNEECGQAVGRAFRGLGAILPRASAGRVGPPA